jgi:hypothetical protein
LLPKEEKKMLITNRTPFLEDKKAGEENFVQAGEGGWRSIH